MPTTSDNTALLRGVRNVRRFRSEPVPETVVDDVLDVARWSGSAMNRQPWEFVVVREPATLRALAATSPTIGWMAGAPLAIVVVMAGEDPEDEGYDEGRVSERILLAARAHGLGAGLGWFPAEAARAAAKALLGVPERRDLRTIVAIGYPDVQEGGGRTSGPARKSLSALVHTERYE